jgi:hypothetical protein
LVKERKKERRGERSTSNVQHPMRKEGVPLRHASRDTSPKQGRSTLDLEGGKEVPCSAEEEEWEIWE